MGDGCEVVSQRICCCGGMMVVVVVVVVEEVYLTRFLPEDDAGTEDALVPVP